MCEQNFPKLWCWYEFIVRNHLWNSEIITQSIQQKISKKVTEIEKCKQQLFTLNMCLPACLWAQIARNPITELGRFLQNVMTINFRDWFISFQHKEKNYRIASMFITTRASVSPPRNVERRESGSMFCEAIETISWSSNESSRKHENIALKSTITK